MNKNKDTIAKLRLSNKKLHQQLAVAKGQAGDEEVILSAFNASSRNEVSLVRSGILSQVVYFTIRNDFYSIDHLMIMAKFYNWLSCISRFFRLIIICFI